MGLTWNEERSARKARLRRGLLPLCLLLAADLIAALAVAWKVPFQAPNPSYLCQALELATTGRVASIFLPIGYAGVLGWSARVGGQAGITALCIGLSLAAIAAAWFYLRTLGLPSKATLGLALFLSAEPDLLLSYNKAQDTALTAALLFVFVALLHRVTNEERWSVWDVLLSVTVGYAVLVRPNLVLFLPLTWFLFRYLRVPSAMKRLSFQAAIVIVLYLTGTTAVHGRPFLAQNGPYNLYAGTNEFTKTYIRNEEDSLPEALALHGITVASTSDGCSQKSADAMRPDIHERRLDPLYTRFALQFMRQHPAEMGELVMLKLATLLSPDFAVHPPGSLGGVLKVAAALVLPLWLLAFVAWPHLRPSATRWIVATTVFCYVLPFLLTVSSARFRVPLDFFLCMDLGAMVVLRRRQATLSQGKRARSPDFVYSGEEI